MQVKHALARPLAVVHHQAEGVAHALLLGDARRRVQQVAEDIAILRAGVRQPGDGLLGDHQDMHRRLRVDVPEGQAAIILIDDVGRDLAVNDLAE